MNVFLLYPDKDWFRVNPYFDWNSIVQDLGLETIFDMAKSNIARGKGDPYLTQVMRKVMQVPLSTKEEVLYRQEILQDCLVHEGLIDELYTIASKTIEDWNKLGRRKPNNGSGDSKAELITDIRVFGLLLGGMDKIRTLFLQEGNRLHSSGFHRLYDRMLEEFPEDKMQQLEEILRNISFFENATLKAVDKDTYKAYKPYFQIDLGLYDGLKFSDMKLHMLSTEVVPATNQEGLISKVSDTLKSLSRNYISPYNDQALQTDTANLESMVVDYVVGCCTPAIRSMGDFFEQFLLQIAFYRGAINLRHQMLHYHLDYCIPTVGDFDDFHYEELKEPVMRVQQNTEAVGNSGQVDGKMLMIITGANQGGKSTFLRSVGIAQVMLQCGLMVTAKEYCSGLFPRFFTHFTRREDASMNSGRLDEELRRMDGIINQVGENSMILLNESFATTTEKEGSRIAYDIIRALKEQGVKIYTVTHLLSFAQKMYEESLEEADSDISFFSAERLENGQRTFKILPHQPELTSFGLELYEEILGNQ